MKSLVLNITNQCNYNCVTCLRGEKTPDNLEPELVDSALTQAKKLGLKAIGITGGEPGLHPEFDRIIDIVFRHKIPYRILSNGFSPEPYMKIIKNPDYLMNYTISFDGPNENIHDAVRGKGSFHSAIKTLKYIQNKGIKVHIQTCVNSLNIDCIEEMVEFCENHNLDSIAFLGIIPNKYNQKYLLSDHQKTSITSKISKINKKYSVHIDIAQSIFTNGGINFCNGIYDLAHIMLNPLGEICFCCDTVHSGAVVGSLKNESYKSLAKKAISYAEYLKKRRKKLLLEGRNILNDCRFCNNELAERIH